MVGRQTFATVGLIVAAIALGLGCGSRAAGERAPAAQSRAGARITGIDHVSFLVTDLAAARRFYGELLGLEEVPPFHAGRGPARTGFRIGSQSIELEVGPASRDGRLGHVAFSAIGLPPGLWSAFPDPDGHRLELVGPARVAAKPGATVPEPSPATPYLRMVHVGVLAHSLAASSGFYRGRLGFQEFWRGGSDPARLDWVNLRVPNGEDYVELMLYEDLPLPEARGGKNHVCIFVADAAAALAAIEARPARQGYTRPLELKVGRNRKRQVNLFDPDGTRVELMEPKTVDGQHAPPSSAPPPRP